MFVTEGRLSQFLTVIDVIDPQAITAGATGVLSAAIDMKNYSKVVAIITSGTLGTSGTLDAQFEASATSGGTYAVVTGHAITQLAKATGDNKVVVLELDRSAVASAAKQFVKFHIVAGTANATSAAVILGVPANYGVASALNDAAVVEIK